MFRSMKSNYPPGFTIFNPAAIQDSGRVYGTLCDESCSDPYIAFYKDGTVTIQSSGSVSKVNAGGTVGSAVLVDPQTSSIKLPYSAGMKWNSFRHSQGRLLPLSSRLPIRVQPSWNRPTPQAGKLTCSTEKARPLRSTSARKSRCLSFSVFLLVVGLLTMQKSSRE